MQKINKILALLLVAVLTVTQLPVTALAANVSEPARGSGTNGEGDEIIAFDTLPEETSNQTVALGTSLEDLNLPNTLNATVRVVAEADIEAPEQESEQPEQEEEEQYEPESDEQQSETQVDPEQIPGETELEQQPLPESDKPEQASAEPEMIEINIPIPVEWISSPDYDGEKTGAYTFTAQIEGFTVSAVPPSIAVIVGEITGTVTAFEEMPYEIRWQNTAELTFPETVGGTVEGEAVQIPVTWQTEQDYDKNASERGFYVFDAVPDEGYTLAEGVEAPRITVYIPETGISTFRMGGGGTVDSPLEINTAAQLAEIAVLVNAGRLESFLFNSESAKVSLKLMNDLNLSGYGQGYNDGKGWKPIGTADKPFKGSFNGNGMIISGLYINDNTRDYVGLFGIAESATMKNLNLTAVSIHAETYVGGIAGCAYYSEIENCRVSGSFSGTNYIGGIAGDIGTYSKVQNCYTTSSISGTNFIGGVAGIIGFGSTVQNCYATGNINGANNIGGIVGEDNGTVQNCVALNPNVEGTKDCGRVVGSHSSGYVIANAAFSGMTVMVGGSKKTPYSFANGIDGEDMTATAIKTDGTIGGRFTTANGWEIENGKLPGFGLLVDMPDYITGDSDPNFPGAGTAAEPFLIGTAEKLAKLAELVNDSATHATYGGQDVYYKLTADIDLSGYGASNTGFNSDKGWVPIGDNTNQFMGNLDGGGHAITGLYINNDDAALYGVGLFGVVKNGTLENFSVSGTVSCTASGFARAGMAVGELGLDATLKNCYTFGSVTATSESSSMAGGLVGEIYMGTMESCYTTVNVSATDFAGGLIGKGTGFTAISCAALNSSVNGEFGVGCIVGDHRSYSILSGNIAFSAMQCTPCGSGYDNGEGKTADELQSASGFPSALTTAPWTYEPGKLPGLFGKTVEMPAHITAKLTSYFVGGGGSQDDPYQIATAAQLVKLAELVNAGDTDYNSKCYQLISDIDLSGYGASNTGFNGGKGWVPIGTKTNKFQGHFDGSHKTITGLYINDADLQHTGLFGNIEGGSVQKLRLTGVSIVGLSSVGGIAGTIKNAAIELCTVSGSIHGTESGGAYIGGVVGMIDADGKVENCYSTGGVSGDLGSGNIGGIAGCLASGTSSVQNCYSTAEVKGGSRVGGIAGATWSYNSVIKNCAALNPTISEGATNGRVVGRDVVPYPGKLAGNRAFSGMIGGGSYKTASGTDGADMTAEQIFTASFWYTDTNWDSTATWANPAWSFQDGYLPLLKGFGPGQSGDGGLYLTERDIANATVNVGGPYTYTGSAIEPSLIVTFDGVTLVKDKDYTFAITSTDDTGSGSSAGTNAGDVDITLTGKGNFFGTTTEYYTIDPKTPTAADLTYNLTAKTYNGLPQPLSVTGKTAGLGAITVKYDGSTTAPKDAKTYTVTVSIAEGTNYAATTADIALGKYIIDKAALTIIGCTIAVKTYDSTKDVSVIGVSFDGVQNGEGFTPVTDYTVTNAQFDSADAGTNKTITGTVSLTNTARANNYSLASGSLSVPGQTIGKAAAPAVSNISKNVMYDDTANQTADIAEKVASYKRTGDTLTYLVGTAGGTNPGIILNPSVNPTGMLTFTRNGGTVANTATIPVTVSGFGNYNDITVNVDVTLTDKTTVIVSLSVPGKTYDGTAVTATASATGIPAGDFTYTWMDSNGTALNPNAAPKNAGSYRVKAVISGDSAKTYVGEKIMFFAIDTATIRIKAKDKSAYVGDAAPVFEVSDYIVFGLAAGEALKTAPTLTYTVTPNMSQTGTYAINISGAVAPDGGNYNDIIYVSGTLTISTKSSGSDEGSGSGGSSSGSDTTITTPKNTPNQPVTAAAPVTATAGAGGSASVSIPDKVITDAIAKAQAEAKKQGRTANDIGIFLDVKMPQGASSLSLTLSQAVLQSLISANTQNLEISGGIASLSFDLEALKEILSQSTGSVTITIKPVQNLSAAAKRLIGTRPVYDVTISYVKDGKTVNITSLNKGSATLSFPYTPGNNEAMGYLFGVYVDGEGNATRIPGSAYDANSRSIIFSADHFSIYGVGYTAPTEKYTDIANHWAKESIDYAVGRGLFSGTADTKFSPDIAMDRGMLVAVLGRLAGADVSVYKTSSFSDVAADKYYLAYVEWAYKKGIISGTGGGKFAPERAVTREEIALILQNYAKVTGHKLPITREVTVYADASGIGSMYKTAVTAMQQADIMVGGSGNKFNPKAGATRAEVAAMLHRYIKLTIDPATAISP